MGDSNQVRRTGANYDVSVISVIVLRSFLTIIFGIHQDKTRH